MQQNTDWRASAVGWGVARAAQRQISTEGGRVKRWVRIFEPGNKKDELLNIERRGEKQSEKNEKIERQGAKTPREKKKDELL